MVVNVIIKVMKL